MIHTRNKHTISTAYSKHSCMYNKFCFVRIKIWNYITDHLDIKVTLPKFKKIIKKSLQTNDTKLPLCK